MSSTEQAPEPTMDEILASIRKIIADDDQNPVPEEQQEPTEAASAVEPQETAAEAQGEQPSLVDDIANALNQEAPPASTEDDIFDLTNEVAQGAPAMDAEMSAPPIPAETAGAAPTEPAQPESPAFSDPMAPPSVEPGAPTIQPEMAQPEPSAETADILSGAPMQEAALPEEAVGFGGAPLEDAGPVPADADFGGGETPAVPEPQESADMAGLAADNLQQAPEVGMADPSAAAPDTMAEPASEEAALDSGTFAAAPVEPEPAPETPMPLETAVEAAPAPMEEPAVVEEAVVAAPVSEVPVEEEVAPAAESGGMTLEDSVKQMLKPLLREWLDDNMERIVQDAVKDEIKAKHNQI